MAGVQGEWSRMGLLSSTLEAKAFFGGANSFR